MLLRRLVRSALVGVLLGFAATVASYLVGPLFVAANAVNLAPPMIMLRVFGAPMQQFLMWVWPKGGLGIGLLVSLFAGLPFWTVLFGVLHFFWWSKRGEHQELEQERPSA